MQVRLNGERPQTTEPVSTESMETRAFKHMPSRTITRKKFREVHAKHIFRQSRLYPFRGHVLRPIRKFNMAMNLYRATVTEFGASYKLRRRPANTRSAMEHQGIARSTSGVLMPLFFRRFLSMALQLGAPLLGSGGLLGGRRSQCLQTLHARAN